MPIFEKDDKSMKGFKVNETLKIKINSKNRMISKDLEKCKVRKEL